MAVRTLDSNNPNDVASASMLKVAIDVPDRELLIFSGIAIPEWTAHDDKNDYRLSWIVNLRYSVLAVDQATITVALASIGNGKTDFLFSVDSAELELDDTTQELSLQLDLALRGDPSALNRVSYQVVVTAVTAVTGISGTIRWNKSIFDPTKLTASQLAQLFRVSANTFYTPTPVGDQFVTEVLTPVAYGLTSGVSLVGDDYAVPYQIPGAPFNTPLKVVVEVGSTFTHPPGTGGVSAAQEAGPRPLNLTPSDPSVTGVDFRITTSTIPR